MQFNIHHIQHSKLIYTEAKHVVLYSESESLVASLQGELKDLKEEMAHLKTTQVSLHLV